MENYIVICPTCREEILLYDWETHQAKHIEYEDFWHFLIRMARKRLLDPRNPQDEEEALDAARSVVAMIPPGPRVDEKEREKTAREIARRLL